jgi:hypothetical protein
MDESGVNTAAKTYDPEQEAVDNAELARALLRMATPSGRMDCPI